MYIVNLLDHFIDKGIQSPMFLNLDLSVNILF